MDDFSGFRVAIRIILRDFAGIRALGAATSEEALKLAQWRRFDAVTSDITRPGMRGLEFLRVFKQGHPDTPVIIVSGSLDEANTLRAKRLGAFYCLPKPFSRRELLGLVRAAIASRRVCRTVLRSPVRR